MDEITFEKSIKSAKNLAEYRYAITFLDFPGAENYIEYRYAKNYIESPNTFLWYPPAETEAVKYTSLPRNSGRELMLPNLLSESKETKMAWDALNLIAQDLLRRGRSLPPELVEWVVDVLADQMVKKGQKRRPRPAKGARRMEYRDRTLCVLICHLIRLFDLNATRYDGKPPISACDVVAAAMDGPYKTVERIWNKRSSFTDDYLSQLDKQALMESPFLSSRNA